MNIFVVDRGPEINVHPAQVSEEEWRKDTFQATLQGEPIIAKRGGFAEGIDYAAFTNERDAAFCASVLCFSCCGGRGH